jgi:hypothetical protein
MGTRRLPLLNRITGKIPDEFIPDLSAVYQAVPDAAGSALGQVVGYDATAGTKKLRWFTSQEHVGRALGWAIVTDSRWAGGADPTGAADSAAAFAAAAAAVASQGGTVYVPSGVFKLSSQITIPTGVRVVGAGIATGGSAVGTQINVNITGGGAAFIGTTGSAAIERLSVISFSASFTGVLVDFTGSTLTELVQCYLQATSSADLLHLKNAIHHRSSKVNFVAGKVQVLGKVLNTDFSNAHIFDECRWGGAATAAIKNAGQAWTINGGASEPGVGGVANFYRHDAGVRGENFTVKGMWFGDISATGPNQTIIWSGDNLAIRDSYCGWNDGTFVTIDENGCNGIVLDNNQYNAFNVHNPTYIVDFGSTTGHTGFQFTNKKIYTPVTAEIAGTMPADTCLTLKPTPIEFGWTVDPRTASLNNGAITANRTVYLRYRGANGPITKIALAVGVSLRQLRSRRVQEHRLRPVRAARYARIGTSGSVACPAAGYQEVALTAAADIRDGDWLSLAADNATPTFALAGGNGTGYALARGLSHFEGGLPTPGDCDPLGHGRDLLVRPGRSALTARQWRALGFWLLAVVMLIHLIAGR